ncbi:hypothetical protein CCH79_00020314 [Gambusia affinis]|uniref:RRM domain-containing protein n=1 Tax=Gambusia affinis TaxID=33528 RepID=A0A315UX97_GAMAF|nr:hypothetical protein CCH79_00020314 [Gambusia affinis]
MQQTEQLGSVPAEHAPWPCGLLVEPRQLPVVLEPEPAEHLDYDRGQNHEADQHPEPEQVPPAVELLGQPQVGAPVQQEGANSDHREGEVDPGVPGGSSALHLDQAVRRTGGRPVAARLAAARLTSDRYRKEHLRRPCGRTTNFPQLPHCREKLAYRFGNMSRVYIGRLSYRAREKDVERFFKGYGKILEVDLKNG